MNMASGIFLNPSAAHYHHIQDSADPQILRFHQRLPDYGITPLIPLPTVASDMGLGKVFLKDESQRFGLPSFKILGASWSIYCTLVARCGLSLDSSLDHVGKAAKEHCLAVVTCSEGNWGRAVSRMARYLGIPATVFVPRYMDDATWNKIASEGATVKRVAGEYDDAITAAVEASKEQNMLLVMDTSWSGFEQSSRWVVEGYSTMLAEVDDQLASYGSGPATLAIASVGVGSWAQAVTQHYKAKEPPGTVATVEPTCAACLKTSLEADQNTPVKTGDTIMCGMNCGTVSSIAWPVLRAGVDASVMISEIEAHEAVTYLSALDLSVHGVSGVNVGPCGAAPFAALKKLQQAKVLRLDAESTVVLFSTEGYRDYVIPN